MNRNIIIRPSFDGISYTSDGAHLYLIGDAEDGLDVKISNVEFDHCGHRRDQVSCLYFHANGDFSGSYIRGISIHESSARGIVLEGEISSVEISNNLIYDVRGHGIALASGSETFNTIDNNLVINPKVSSRLWQTDNAPAGFYISHPLNSLTNNVAVGSSSHGFWYNLPSRVSVGNCPTGSNLGVMRNNIAHNNDHYGFRLNNFAARTFPCSPLREERVEDPYARNPSIRSVFEGFVAYNNLRSNVLLESLGNSVLQNFTLSSSPRSLELYRTNLTKE